jgi:hypothetical protein
MVLIIVGSKELGSKYICGNLYLNLLKRCLGVWNAIQIRLKLLNGLTSPLQYFNSGTTKPF